MKFRLALVAAASFALAACSSADDASTEAEADTVEVSAAEAMAPIEEEPVADPEASIEEATENAAATAEAAMDAMGEDPPQ